TSAHVTALPSKNVARVSDGVERRIGSSGGKPTCWGTAADAAVADTATTTPTASDTSPAVQQRRPTAELPRDIAATYIVANNILSTSGRRRGIRGPVLHDRHPSRVRARI